MTFPPSDTWGEKHVALALQDLEFPLSKDQLLARAGRWNVPITGTRMVPLSDLLEGVEADNFRSPADVARAVKRARR